MARAHDPLGAGPEAGEGTIHVPSLSSEVRSPDGLRRIVRLTSDLLDAPAQLVVVSPSQTRVLAATPTDAATVPLRVARQIATAEGATTAHDLDGTVWFGAPVPSWTTNMRAALCARTSSADGGRTRAALVDLASLACDVLRLEGSEADAAALRHLLGTASHDLRNPLSVLRAGLETMTEHGLTLAPVQAERIATLAVRQAKRMSTMIDGLLAVHAVDAQELVDDVDLRPIVSDVLEGGRLIHRLVDLAVIGQIPTEPVIVRGTADALARVVTNLVTNAAVHGGGQVWIGLVSTDVEAIVTIEDDGPGLPANTPLDGGGGDLRPGGHGLGLVIARRIVQGHLGTIEHRSRPEGGTCIEVRLPLASARF